MKQISRQTLQNPFEHKDKFIIRQLNKFLNSYLFPVTLTVPSNNLSCYLKVIKGMKTDNWRQIYKQTNSVFFSSNEVRLKNNVLRRKPVAVAFLYKSVEVHTSLTAYVIAVYFVSKGIPENGTQDSGT